MGDTLGVDSERIPLAISLFPSRFGAIEQCD